jgi:integrase/recombinase XerC
LDVADVTPGRTGRVRRSSAHPGLRRALRNWIVERADWPAAGQEPALFLNYRGGRLSCRSISTILAGIAEAADLDRTVIRRVLHYRPADSERAS